MLKALTKAYDRIPRPSMKYNLKQLKHNPYEMLPKNAVVLDVGSKSAEGNYAFAKKTDDARMISLDIEAVSGIDIQADANFIPIKSNSVDCVMSLSVLECIPHPERVMKEMLRILKPGGLVYIDVPFVLYYSPDPVDYYRFSVDGIRVLCEDFEEIQAGFNRGPASTMCCMTVHYLAILVSFNSTHIYRITRDLFIYLLFWTKYLDIILGRMKHARIIHSGVFFLGRKVEQA